MREIPPLTLSEFDAAPFQVAASRVLQAPIGAVFAELGDPSGWFPMMASSMWVGRVGGVGGDRDVHVRTFGKFREHMIAWEPDRRVSFTMTQSSSPLVARMGEDFQLRADGGGTRLDWRMVIYPKTIARPLQPVLKIIVGRMAAIAVKRLERRAKAHGTHAA